MSQFTWQTRNFISLDTMFHVTVPTKFGKFLWNHPIHGYNHCTIWREHNHMKMDMQCFSRNTDYVLYGDMVILLQVFITKILCLTNNKEGDGNVPSAH